MENIRVVLEMEEDANLQGVLNTCRNLSGVNRVEIE